MARLLLQSVSLCLSIHPSTALFVCVCLSARLSVFLPRSLIVGLFPSVLPTLRLSVACLPACLSVCLSLICLHLYLQHNGINQRKQKAVSVCMSAYSIPWL